MEESEIKKENGEWMGGRYNLVKLLSKPNSEASSPVKSLLYQTLLERKEREK